MSTNIAAWDDWTRLVRPRTGAVVGAAVAAGLAMDLAVQQGPPTVSGALLVAVAAGGLLVAARPSNPQAVAAICAAPLFGACLAVRASVWLLPLDVLAAAALLGIGSLYARGGSVLDLSVPATVDHALRAVVNAVLAPGFLVGSHPSRSRAAAIGRGALLALPLVVVVGALLASADAVFASAFRVDGAELVTHVVALALGAWGMAWLVRLASADRSPAVVARGRVELGRTEWTVILVSLDVLLAGFGAARLAALTEGGRRVIATSGLTYAEYARSGFFQLLAAVAVSLGALLAVRAVVRPEDRRRFVVLTEIGLSLLLLAVVQAVQRLALYERAFGLTMPRLLAIAVCLWLAVAIVALGAWVGGAGGRRHWYWTAVGAAALAILFTLNALNAEALVVRRNVAHAAATGRFDVSELDQLGPDAVPALEAALARLDGHARSAIVARLCRTRPEAGSVWSYNGSMDASVEARNRVCTRRTG